MIRISAMLLLPLTILLCLGCGPPEPTPTPAPKTIQTEGIAPTPTRPPTPTMYPTYTPYPAPDIEATVVARVQAAIDTMPTPAPTATPAPTEIPTPTLRPEPTATSTPAPIVRPVGVPAGLGAQAFSVSNLQMNGRTLIAEGSISSQNLDPTSVQVWQAYDPEPYSATCSTERPVAFIRPGNGGASYTGITSPYEWTFCRNGVSHSPQVDNVPWLYAQQWSYTLRQRIRVTDPYIYDFRLRADLDIEQVERLEYGSGVASGWRVIIFSGDRILANLWIDY